MLAWQGLSLPRNQAETSEGKHQEGYDSQVKLRFFIQGPRQKTDTQDGQRPAAPSPPLVVKC